MVLFICFTDPLRSVLRPGLTLASYSSIFGSDSFVLGRSDYHWRFEPITRLMKAKHLFHWKRDLSNVWDDWSQVLWVRPSLTCLIMVLI